MHVRNKSLGRPWAQAIVLAMLTAPAIAEPPRDHTIFALEHALVGVGYELNPVDGIMDPVTEKALRDYQSKQPGLVPTGQIDDATLMALGITPVNSAPSTPRVQPEATKVSAATEADSAQPESNEADQEKQDGRGWFFF